MKKCNLNQIHSLAKYPMTIVMAQAWFCPRSAAMRFVAVALRDAREDLA